MDVEFFAYFGLAEKILAGGHITAAGVHSPDAMRVPLYPYLLAVVFYLNGGRLLDLPPSRPMTMERCY